jgi:hypothetical protein
MVLRFLMTTASQAPGYPFMAGQEITVSDLTAEMRQWVADGRAEIVSDVPELATLAPHEQAIVKRGRRK